MTTEIYTSTYFSACVCCNADQKCFLRTELMGVHLRFNCIQKSVYNISLHKKLLRRNKGVEGMGLKV